MSIVLLFGGLHIFHVDFLCVCGLNDDFIIINRARKNAKQLKHEILFRRRKKTYVVARSDFLFRVHLRVHLWSDNVGFYACFTMFYAEIIVWLQARKMLQHITVQLFSIHILCYITCTTFTTHIFRSLLEYSFILVPCFMECSLVLFSWSGWAFMYYVTLTHNGRRHTCHTISCRNHCITLFFFRFSLNCFLCTWIRFALHTQIHLVVSRMFMLHIAYACMHILL